MPNVSVTSPVTHRFVAYLVGASSVGKTQHVGVLRGLIESKIHLGKWKQRLMQDPTAIMEAYIACTQELGYS